MSTIKRFVILALVAAAVVAAFLLREARSPKSTEDTASQRAAEGTAELAEDSQDPALPRLVDLGANTCIPCKMMAPILEELKQEYSGSLIVAVIDLRENREAAKEYDIRVIPTQIFFDASGRERLRHEGFMSKEAILAAWKRLGVDLTPNGRSGS